MCACFKTIIIVPFHVSSQLLSQQNHQELCHGPLRFLENCQTTQPLMPSGSLVSCLIATEGRPRPKALLRASYVFVYLTLLEAGRCCSPPDFTEEESGSQKAAVTGRGMQSLRRRLVCDLSLRVSPGSRTAGLSESEEPGFQLHTSRVTLDKTHPLTETSLASIQWRQDLPACPMGFCEGVKRSLMCKYLASGECLHEGTETGGQVQSCPCLLDLKVEARQSGHAFSSVDLCKRKVLEAQLGWPAGMRCVI